MSPSERPEILCKFQASVTNSTFLSEGNNMSVLGSQLEIDMDPEGEAAVIPRHVGNTGTGCYKLHDHRMTETKKRANAPVPAPGSTLIVSKDNEEGGTASEGSTKRKPGQKGAGGKSGSSSAGASTANQANGQAATQHLLDAPLIGGKMSLTAAAIVAASQAASVGDKPTLTDQQQNSPQPSSAKANSASNQFNSPSHNSLVRHTLELFFHFVVQRKKKP